MNRHKKSKVEKSPSMVYEKSLWNLIGPENSIRNIWYHLPFYIQNPYKIYSEQKNEPAN